MQLRTVLYLLLCSTVREVVGDFIIGVGKGDVTGPPLGDVAMGYAKPSQLLHGIHTRLWARAFLIGSPNVKEKRIMYVVLESCFVSHAVYMEVLERLKDIDGGIYNEKNVAIAATHTHTAPSGYSDYFLYGVVNRGFDNDTFNAQVDGILEAVHIAHESAEIGTIRLVQGELDGMSINRSPTAYSKNWRTERAHYSANVDKTMTMLQFTDQSGKDLGILNWFPVHGTSLNNSVKVISGDNKGLASLLFEKNQSYINSQFVAAFAQSNSGDVSPNTVGAFCQDTNLPCDVISSTCDGKNELCQGRGPGWPNCFKSNQIIGEGQFQKAYNLSRTSKGKVELDAIIDFKAVFIDISNITLVTKAGRTLKTCKPALGSSFAAGTTDGPGAFDFTQASTQLSPFWKKISQLLVEPSSEQIECQAPKPVLIDSGELTEPTQWQPTIVPIQLLRIGGLVLVCFPAELTTMAGRRLKNLIKEAVKAEIENVEVVISGLTNVYSGYVTTYNEYRVQRYEGASTLYGPHTLAAYQQEFVKLAQDLVQGTATESHVFPPTLKHQAFPPLSFLWDSVPPLKKFGAPYRRLMTRCYAPGEVITAEFWSSNPRSCLGQRNHTFLTVEYLYGVSGDWTVELRDADASTQISWRRYPLRLFYFSVASVSWTIPENYSKFGAYRIQHYGCLRNRFFTPTISQYHGQSERFWVDPFCVNSQDTSSSNVRPLT